MRNPASGRGAGARHWPKIEQKLRANFPDSAITVYPTEGPGHARELAERAVYARIDLIVACGGDGTLQEVANAAIDSMTPLGLIPLGTGNDVARSIGIGTDTDLAIQTLAKAPAQLTDAIWYEIGDKKGWSLNACGVGMDAAVGQRINQGFRYLRGTAAYIAAILDTLVRYKPSDMCIEVDGTSFNTHAMLCTVANCRSYGGGMLIAPMARMDDGVFDIIVIDNVDKLEFIRTFPKVFSGKHLEHPKVKAFAGRRVTIESHPPRPVLVDGEILPPGVATFEIRPNVLRFVRPIR